MKAYYIGLMSGTSMDGVDAALIEMDGQTLSLIDFVCVDYPNTLKSALLQLCIPGDNEIDQLGQLDIQVALSFSNAVNYLLEKNALKPHDIKAIGSHGQTLRHRPDFKPAFTLQVGDPNTIAVQTQIDVIADFRRKDMALGGQGAPLVPAFHHGLFASNKAPRAIINIGGISNITMLPDSSSESVTGFDIGPGNCLMDVWIKKHLNKNYDAQGAWAKTGQCISSLLDYWLDDPFFSKIGPKSSGIEYFNLNWIETGLTQLSLAPPAQDVQATLLALTVEAIARVLESQHPLPECYLCGGGAYNVALMESLNLRLKTTSIITTDALNLSPESVEAACFAWLAHAFITKTAGNLPSVTGASRRTVLGAMYPHY